MITATGAASREIARKRVAVYVVLLIAGLLGNRYGLSIVNAQFLFGSFFALLALQAFGMWPGILAGLIIASYTLFSWNHPVALITMGGEIACVGWFVTRRRPHLVAIDLAYWLILGIPLGYLSFRALTNVPSDVAWFLMAKQATNGVANALLARFVFCMGGWLLARRKVSLREAMACVVALCIVLLAIASTALEGRRDLRSLDQRIRASLMTSISNGRGDLERWLADRETTVALLAQLAQGLTAQEMQARLEQAQLADSTFVRFSLLDRDGIAVAYSPAEDELGRPNIGKDFSDRPYWPRVVTAKTPLFTDALPSRFGDEGPVALYIAPVWDDGGFAGAVAGVLDLASLRQRLNLVAVGQQLDYSLLDAERNVIITSRTDLVGLESFSLGEGSYATPGGILGASLPPWLRTGSATPTDGILQWYPSLPENSSSVDLWGKSVYVLESIIREGSGWALLMEQPVAPFQAELYQAYTAKFWLIFVVLVLSVALGELIGKRMLARLEQLATETHDLPERIESGERVAWHESGTLEIQHLTENIKRMAESIQDRMLAIRRMNESLEEHVQQRTEELRESETLVRSVLESTPVMLYLKDAESLRFVDINRAGEELIGLPRERIIGQSAMDLFPPADAALYMEEDRLAITLGERLHRSEEPVHSLQLGDRIASTTRVPLASADGSIRYILGVSEDITERKRNYDEIQEANRRLQDSQSAMLNVLEDLRMDIAEREKAEAEILRLVERQAEERALLRTLIDNMPDIVYVKDAQGRYIVTNEAAAMAFGANSPEETLGKTDQDLLPPDRAEVHREVEETLLRTGQPILEREEEIVDAKGRTRWYSSTRVALRSSTGEITGIVGIEHDITERRELEAQFLQSQKMEAVGRLAGGVAHDFNNMLTVILGHTELALASIDESEPLHADLSEVRKAAERSAALTRQLLAFARRQTVAPRPLSLTDTVEGMLKMLRRLIGEEINLRWYPTAQSWLIKIDPAQVDQILANLCVNARDAISGFGEVTIETANVVIDEEYCASHPEAVPGEYVMLAVSDTGSGMDRETLSHIFEPFYTTKNPGEGTGLGLPTVYGIAKQNQGFVNVYSEPGQGSTFRIYLPRYVGEGDALSQADGQSIPAGRGETILLVEDEAAILMLGTKMLQELGYRVLAAGSPAEAMRLAEKENGGIPLLVTDLVMPEMNGRQLAEALRAAHPAMRTVYMSGYTANVIAHHGVVDEGVYFLQKPFSRRDLAAKVRAALDGR